jgi:hypothetical protein
VAKCLSNDLNTRINGCTALIQSGSGLYQADDLAEPAADHDQAPVVIGTEPFLRIIVSQGMRLRGLPGLARRMIG